MSRLAHAALAVATLGLLGGCWTTDVAIDEPEIPGFELCALRHLPEVRYELCAPPDWPGGAVRGRALDGPGFFDSRQEFEFIAEDGTRYTLSGVAHFQIATEGLLWWGEEEQTAPLVSLRIEGDCDGPDALFEVRTADGALLVAGGHVEQVELRDWTIDGSSPSPRCSATADEDCPCHARCVSQPIRFAHTDGGAIELHPSERARVDGVTAMVFDGWRGEGDSSCEDAPDEAFRWLLIDEAAEF